ncbi:MAG: hypothetical protein JXQ96_10705 [Cyclobacteriaceae bacterium]
MSDRFELVISSMRILTLLDSFKTRKNFLNFDRIILFDFYLRFPRTMFDEKNDVDSYDFEELYSYYHSHPNRENYSKVLNYLISKKLILKEIVAGSFKYSITETGSQIVSEITNPFALSLKNYAVQIRKKVAYMSETKLREDINCRSLENMRLI